MNSSSDVFISVSYKVQNVYDFTHLGITVERREHVSDFSVRIVMPLIVVLVASLINNKNFEYGFKGFKNDISPPLKKSSVPSLICPNNCGPCFSLDYSHTLWKMAS